MEHKAPLTRSRPGTPLAVRPPSQTRRTSPMRRRGWLALPLMTALLAGAPGRAGPDPQTAPDPAAVRAAIDRAYDSLRARQNADGSFAPKLGGPGITALVAAALIRAGRGPEDPVVA